MIALLSGSGFIILIPRGAIWILAIFRLVRTVSERKYICYEQEGWEMNKMFEDKKDDVLSQSL
jgi:hypothetical protein